jgi:hypothetical protein
MLIVANGAYKSGSTWLYNIVAELTGFGAPPARYLDPEWKHPSIRPGKLHELLASLGPADRFLVKNHFGEAWQRDALLAHPDVRVLDIERALPDVVVSAYHHARRVNGFAGSFERFYWTKGRGVAGFVVDYHALWTPSSARIFCSSYERLHLDFEGEVARLARFLGVATTPSSITAVQQATTLEQLRERYGSSHTGFFRKGAVGDSSNYLNPAIAASLAWTARSHALRRSPPYRALRTSKRWLTAKIAGPAGTQTMRSGRVDSE